MKGLKEYIAKHGRHLTVELANSFMGGEARWNKDSVMESMQKKVYYNVTGTSDADLYYWVNMCYEVSNVSGRRSTKNRCIKDAVRRIGDMEYEGWAFDNAVMTFALTETDFDFTPYI